MRNTITCLGALMLLSMLPFGNHVYAQKIDSCVNLLQETFFKNLVADGVLLSAEKKRDDSLYKRKKDYKKEHDYDNLLRLELKRLRLFGDCNMDLANAQLLGLNGESLAAMGSRVILNKNLENIDFGYKPDFSFPEKAGFGAANPNGTFHKLQISSSSLNKYTAQVSAEVKAYLQAKIAGDLSDVTRQQRMFSAISGSFDTYQGEIIQRIREGKAIDIGVLDFFTEVWNAPFKRTPSHYIINRITGVLLHSTSDYTKASAGSAESNINAAFDFPLAKINGSFGNINRFQRDISSSSSKYQFYKVGTVDFGDMPTNQQMITSWERTFRNLVKITSAEINLDESDNGQIIVQIDSITREIGNMLRFNYSAFVYDPVLSKVIDVDPNSTISYQETNGKLSATFTIPIKVKPGLKNDLSSEVIKNGFTYLPVNIYYDRPIGADTLFIVRSFNNVKLTLKKLPSVSQENYVLEFKHMDTTTAARMAHFEGIINFEKASNQTFSEPVKGTSFFTQLSDVETIPDGKDLQVRFILANATRHEESGFKVSLSVPAKFLKPDDAVQYKVVAAVPMKLAGKTEVERPRRYVTLILPAPAFEAAGGGNE